MPDYSYSYLAFSPDIEAAYRTLLPHHFGADEANKVAWKLRDHPAGAGGAVVVRDDAGTIVGLNAFQPTKIANAAGETLVGHQSMDTIVAPAARGQGLFPEMIRTFYAESGSAFLYGFPNDKSGPGFFNKLGWSQFGQVPMKLRPLRTGFVARRFGLGKFDLPLARRPRRKVQAQPIERFGEAHSEAWRRNLAEMPAVWSIDRTAAYLNWRFVDHPTERYERRGGADGSYCVTKLAEKHDAKILYVLDLAGPAEAAAGLLRDAVGDALERGAEVAFAWNDGRGAAGAAQRRAGFLAFPEALRPIKLFFGANMLASAPSAPRSAREWWVSYADSDTV